MKLWNQFWNKFLGFDPNRERSFPGQQPGEEVVLMSVFHWMTLVPFMFYLSLMILGYVSFYYASGIYEDLSPLSRLGLNTGFLAVILQIFCFRLYNYSLKVMIITNFRMIEVRHTVFLKREREVIPMTNIQDIRFRQRGILPRVFKYGDLIVFGASTDVKYQFHHVIRVNKIHHLLNEIRHQAVNQGQPRLNAEHHPRMIRDYSLREQ